VRDDLDFIVIGAQKAGTTSLFEYAREHPEISAPPGKEAPYFTDCAQRRRGWQAYLRQHFGRCDPRTKWGTFTPQYMWGATATREAGRADPETGASTVPARIHALLPAVRLIAILRDPIERAISHHAMAVMNRHEHREVNASLRAELAPDALRAARSSPSDYDGYVPRGEYGRILQGYYSVFPSEQILVVYTDELERDPGGVMRRMFAFLGLRDTDFVPTNLGTVYRPSSTRRRLPGLTSANIGRLAERLLRMPWIGGGWERLSSETRVRLLQKYSAATYALNLWNRRSGSDDGRPALDPALRTALRRHYADDTQLLTTLTGSPPPWER
jgi:hypothetical protein